MMKPLSIVGVLAAATVALILFAACGSDDSEGSAVASPVLSEAQDCELGGTYPFPGDENKVSDFRSYQANGLSFSEGVLLSKDPLSKDKKLLEHSVSADQKVSRDNGYSTLKYNYVVSTDDCEIYVATWTKSTDDIDEHLMSKMIQCHGGRSTVLATTGRMINFWPEDNDIATSSPCWLDQKDGINKNGILDAMSKHFILAQMPGSQTIQQMGVTDIGDSAAHRKVAYGGEIIVDLDDCTYKINNGSGTYKPKDHNVAIPLTQAPSYLMAVAGMFKAQSSVGPTFVQSWVPPGKVTPMPVPVEATNQEIPGCEVQNGPASDTS